jgi:hypothetical protein
MFYNGLIISRIARCAAFYTELGLELGIFGKVGAHLNQQSGAEAAQFE